MLQRYTTPLHRSRLLIYLPWSPDQNFHRCRDNIGMVFLCILCGPERTGNMRRIPGR